MKFSIRNASLLLVLIATTSLFAQGPSAEFSGVTKWQASLNAADASGLANLYSTNPPAKYVGLDRKAAPDITPETEFWKQTLASGVHDVKVTSIGAKDQQGLKVMALEVAMKVKTPKGVRTRYVMEQQAWQSQDGVWKIVMATHSELMKMRPALKPNPKLYDTTADAKVEISDAQAKAAKLHQRVILMFGGNWCYDCHVLDQAFHQADVAPLLTKNFQIVHIDIGDDGKKNNDLAEKYGIPLAKGVPALAVLSAEGKLLFSQKGGEFESARSMDPDDVIAFLEKWKP